MYLALSARRWLLALGLGVIGPMVAGARPLCAQMYLSACTSNVFIPDGNIGEFISACGDPQLYFDLEDGRLLDGVQPARGVAMKIDEVPGPHSSRPAGPTGFADSPGGFGELEAPTGFNIGRVFASFNAELDTIFVAMDISAPRELDRNWRTQPVAFDVDGDGSRQEQSEIIRNRVPEAPTTFFSPDQYSASLDMNGDGWQEFGIIISERRSSSAPDNSTEINPNGNLQVINNQSVLRYVTFVDTTRLIPGTPREQAIKHLDTNDDGTLDWRDFGVGDDIEIAIRRVSELPGFAGFVGIHVTVAADSFDDVELGGGGEDRVTIEAGVNCFDGDRDGDVDLLDWQLFQNEFSWTHGR